jgi:membrane protein implicated in regulation of membrane protease activity
LGEPLLVAVEVHVVPGAQLLLGGLAVQDDGVLLADPVMHGVGEPDLPGRTRAVEPELLGEAGTLEMQGVDGRGDVDRSDHQWLVLVDPGQGGDRVTIGVGAEPILGDGSIQERVRTQVDG